MRVGVQPGSWFHVTECFGPVLGVMRADDLDHAIELQNGTAVRPHRRHPLARRRRGRALARRCARRQRLRQPRHHRGDRATPAVRWMEAIVGRLRAEGRRSGLRRRDGHRQPDGRSGTEVAERPTECRGRGGSASTHDPTGLASERNDLRYRPLDGVLVRVGPDTPAGCARALLVRCRPSVVRVSSSPDAALRAGRRVGRAVGRSRRRAGAHADDGERRAARRAAERTASKSTVEPVSISGRRELRRWLREQAISRTTHRHGRVAP